jgi:uncharacterized cupredoxin-like copper-binding protein
MQQVMITDCSRQKGEKEMKQRFLIAFGPLALILLLAACGATSGNTTGGGMSSTNVQVIETDFHINTTVTSFLPGITYHFVVTNNGQMAHEFMIMPKSEGSMSGMPMGDMDTMALASISILNPGGTKTLDYTFPSSMNGSHPEFVCYFPGHYEAGMKKMVNVKS